MIVRALKKESFPFCGVIVSHADMTQQPTQGANAPPGARSILFHLTGEMR